MLNFSLALVVVLLIILLDYVAQGYVIRPHYGIGVAVYGVRTQANLAGARPKLRYREVHPSCKRVARMSMDKQLQLQAWFHDCMDVLIFSGNPSHSRTPSQLNTIANHCRQQARERLVKDSAFREIMASTLSNAAFSTLGDRRLCVQGQRLSLGDCTYEEDKISELLCLVRGPEEVGFGDYWIGIVRHDETPYIVSGLEFLLRHIVGRGFTRQLIFAKDAHKDDDWKESTWSSHKVDQFNKLIK